jgi:hypothetical protein
MPLDQRHRYAGRGEPAGKRRARFAGTDDDGIRNAGSTKHRNKGWSKSRERGDHSAAGY